MWNRIKNFLLENLPIISFFTYLKSNRKIGKFLQGISDWRIDEDDRSQLRKMLRLTIERLEDLNKLELERKEIIESKAKANLTFISIAVTIAFAGTTLMLTTLPQDSFFVKYDLSIKALIGISVIYLIQGGISALAAMSFPYIYMGVVYKDLTKSNKAAASLKIAKDILRNQYTNIQRSNCLDLTQKSIKNGLIVLSILIFAMLVMLKPTINNTNKKTTVQIENLYESLNTVENAIEKQTGQIKSVNNTLNNIVIELSELKSKIGSSPKSETENLMKK